MADYGEYAASVDLNGVLPMPVRADMSSPIRHRGQSVGIIFVGHDQEGWTFSAQDEETILMFSAQAAMVIANARQYRDERRARDDLETLIDTSPVGVVVFDAVTGAPKSFNREARRIVDSLREPDQTPEQLLGVLTCVRADGREVSLAESPMVELLSAGETVRAEEVVISVPDGRSVTVLINATPIFSEDGAVGSMVVTLQDMAEVRELERLRAEFLAMVSHELRAPLTTIKGSSATVLDSPTDFDPAVMRQFFRIIGDQADHMNALVTDLLDVARIDTGTLPVSPGPAEVAVLVDRARGAFSNGGGRHRLEIDIAPDLPLVLADQRRIVQVLVNLLTNAARQSPSSAAIRVSAVGEGVYVADEGRGIPAERLPHLFRKFSGTQSDEPGGDTGLGLAICQGIVEAHGGRIRAESDGPGLGARFTFTLPTVDTAGSVRMPPVPTRSGRREQSESDGPAPVPVLAVDDDPNDLRYIRDTLANAGYRPVVTGDPQEAVRLMEEEGPGLVLLDLILPDTDGIELMQSILGVADVPVIFLSAYGREEVVARGLRAGGRRLRGQALLAHRAGGPDQRGPAPAGRPRSLGASRHGRPDRGLRPAPGDPGRASDAPDPDGVPDAVRTGRPRRPGGDPRTLLERVWGERSSGSLRPLRTMVSKLRRKLGDDADNPTYIFTEPRVGFRMPRGREAKPE